MQFFARIKFAPLSLYPEDKTEGLVWIPGEKTGQTGIRKAT
jgi:hypothetical protein